MHSFSLLRMFSSSSYCLSPNYKINEWWLVTDRSWSSRLAVRMITRPVQESTSSANLYRACEYILSFY